MEELLKKLIKMSKIIICLLAALLIAVSFGVSSLYNSDKDTSNNSKEESSEYNTKYDVSMMKEISASEVVNNTKNLSVIYVGRSTCSWCAAFLPNLWNAQEDYGFKTLYVDIAKIIDFENNKVSDQNAYEVMTKLTGTGYEKYVSENFGSTPMILIMKDGKIIKAQTGYNKYDEFKKLLEEAGFSKK